MCFFYAPLLFAAKQIRKEELKMKKKLLALSLVAVMALGVLAGCSSSEETTGETTETEGTE